MRISRFSFVLSALLLLSACGTVHDDPAQHSDISNWYNSRPSKIENYTWKWPSGYAGQGQYREVRTEQGSVSTFPIDDASAPMASAAPAGAESNGMSPPPPRDEASYYGNLAQQVFFAHGSSALNASEKNSLQALAQSLAQSPGEVSVTVVGHASTRVNGVSDPIAKKTINFEIAQKRADAVTSALKKSGVNPGWVQAISKGDDEPNATPGGREQEAADRRVEIFTKQ